MLSASFNDYIAAHDSVAEQLAIPASAILLLRRRRERARVRRAHFGIIRIGR